MRFRHTHFDVTIGVAHERALAIAQCNTEMKRSLRCLLVEVP